MDKFLDQFKLAPLDKYNLIKNGKWKYYNPFTGMFYTADNFGRIDVNSELMEWEKVAIQTELENAPFEQYQGLKWRLL